MGMIANMLQVTNEELEEIIIDSSILEERIFSENSQEDPSLLSIDKSWEGIFFILTGKTITEIENVKSPLAWMLFSDKIVDEEQDLGYGPANYIDSDQVKQLNVELKRVTPEDFKTRYDAARMNDLHIYPQNWTDNGDDLAYLTENFLRMKTFYERAAIEGKCVINFLN